MDNHPEKEMIKIKNNFHTHTYLCKHAKGNIEDYMKIASEYGFKAIGFTDHGPLKESWTQRMSIDEFNNIYLKEIEEAKQKYPKIKIYSGLEIEYFEEYNRLYEDYLLKLDYLILGQHETSFNNSSVFKTMTMESIIAYKNDVIEGMKSGYFKVLAHPDVFLCRTDIWNEEIENICREIIECSIENKVYLEINCNGFRKNILYYTNDNIITYSFPRLEFWRMVSKYKNALIIIGADAHTPEQLVDDYVNKAYTFAKELNLNVKNNIFEDGESNEKK